MYILHHEDEVLGAGAQGRVGGGGRGAHEQVKFVSAARAQMLAEVDLDRQVCRRICVYLCGVQYVYTGDTCRVRVYTRDKLNHTYTYSLTRTHRSGGPCREEEEEGEKEEDLFVFNDTIEGPRSSREC